MQPFIEKIRTYFARDLWSLDLRSVGRVKAFQIKLLRLLYVFVTGLSEEQLSLRAMGLVYTTLLSLVPLLAVSFSVLKAFGVHTRFEIFLYYLLEPLGDRGVDLSLKVIEFVENVNVGVLGSIGLSTLIYTVLSNIQKIESALNFIWHVKNTRSFSRRFSNYLSVLLVGPVLIFSAVGLTASFRSTAFIRKLTAIEPFGTAFYFAGRVVPYIFVCSALTLIYVFLPNAKVRFRAALAGGVFAAVVWEATGWTFTSFIVSSAQYSAIYSGFAILILFIIWLYWSWFVLLAGARIAYYYQHPRSFLTKRDDLIMDSRSRERLAVLVMYLIGHNFHYGKPRWRSAALVERTGLSDGPVRETLEALEKSGLLVRSGEEPPAYLPARDLGAISLKEVLDSARTAGAGRQRPEGGLAATPEVDNVMRRLDEAIAGSFEKETVRGLVLAGEQKT